MRGTKVLFATLTAGALLAASVSSAEARWFRHRGPGPIAGLLGGVVVGAATIATLPFALLADAARPGPPPRSYYGPDNDGYGPPQGAYGYGPPPGYRGQEGYGYGPPPPPPPRYYRSYGPPPGYYGNGY